MLVTHHPHLKKQRPQKKSNGCSKPANRDEAQHTWKHTSCHLTFPTRCSLFVFAQKKNKLGNQKVCLSYSDLLQSLRQHHRPSHPEVPHPSRPASYINVEKKLVNMSVSGDDSELPADHEHQALCCKWRVLEWKGQQVKHHHQHNCCLHCIMKTCCCLESSHLFCAIQKKPCLQKSLYKK